MISLERSTIAPRAPLLLIDCERQEVDFLFGAGSAATLGDLELALAALWVFAAQDFRKSPFTPLRERFEHISQLVTEEWNLRHAREPVRMNAVMACAINENPQLASSAIEAASGGEQVYHLKHGYGRIVEQDRNRVLVDFNIGGRRWVVLSFLTSAAQKDTA